MLYVAFCTIMAISRQKEARSRDYALLLFRMTSRVLYSAQYHRQHCTLHAFEQFGALYIHSHDDKYPSRPGFQPGTPRLQATVDTNEPLGPAYMYRCTHNSDWILMYYHDYIDTTLDLRPQYLFLNPHDALKHHFTP